LSLAPADFSKSTISVRPSLAAHVKAVAPSAPLAFTSATCWRETAEARDSNLRDLNIRLERIYEQIKMRDLHCKNFSKSWTFLVLFFALLVLASPMPPFYIIPKTPSYILIPQLLALCVLAIGAGIGSLLSQPLVQFFSIVGIVLCLWQLPYIDWEYIEAQGCRLLSGQGIVAQASIINSDWRQPQAIFFLFRGGGGHPTHIFDLELRFSTIDSMAHVVHISESYPPGWNTNFIELLNTFRKGNVIPIRYLANDATLVRSQNYLDSFKPAAVANPFFVVIAPWIFAVPVLIGLFFSKRKI
jgi:hypothetical protein